MDHRNAEEIANEAIARIKERLTDEVFLTIQNDRQLMADFLHEVEACGWKAVNQRIGRTVKMAFPGIENKNRCRTPESVILQSFTEFE